MNLDVYKRQVLHRDTGRTAFQTAADIGHTRKFHIVIMEDVIDIDADALSSGDATTLILSLIHIFIGLT